MVSRNGDSGNRLAAEEILPLFCVLRGVSRRLRQKPDEAFSWHHSLAKLLQIKENRKLKFILPMLYYIDDV